ncbi:MAG: hypothetical protein Q4E67_04420 [Planctomycetia bacterium]|nr:hypothetical protein [Planctomycetia bacterium]
MTRYGTWLMALVLGMAGTTVLADDDYEIARGQVEYDWEDGELNFDDLAEIRVMAKRVSTSRTQTGEQLVLEGVSLQGVDATLRVSVDNRFPGAIFMTWDLPAGTNLAAVTFPVIELDDDWNPNRAKITTNAQNTQVEVTDDREVLSVLAGWLVAEAGDSVKVGTFRRDLSLEVQGKVRSQSTGTFCLGAFRDLTFARQKFAEMEKTLAPAK